MLPTVSNATGTEVFVVAAVLLEMGVRLESSEVFCALFLYQVKTYVSSELVVSVNLAVQFNAVELSAGSGSISGVAAEAGAVLVVLAEVVLKA